jgi:hypothetical protein
MYYGGLGAHMQQMSVHKIQPVLWYRSWNQNELIALCSVNPNNAWVILHRTGNEYLLFELAKANIETLNELSLKRIVTTCPHCLYKINNEYPLLVGEFDVIHHSPNNFRINRK